MMQVIQKIVVSTLIVGFAAASIWSVNPPDFDWANANLLTQMTIHFRLDNRLPPNCYLRIDGPTDLVFPAEEYLTPWTGDNSGEVLAENVGNARVRNIDNVLFLEFLDPLETPIAMLSSLKYSVPLRIQSAVAGISSVLSLHTTTKLDIASQYYLDSSPSFSSLATAAPAKSFILTIS